MTALHSRRGALCAIAAAAALASRAVRAAAWRPLRIIVPQAAGGAADATARLIGESLVRNLHRSVMVENRPGGGTIAGTLALANAEPDGDTIGFVISAHAINQAMRRRMPYDALSDFEPVCLCGYSVLVLVCDPEFPAGNVRELIALAANATPRLQYASLGVGSGAHLAGELFNIQAGVQIQHVPFNGSVQVYQALMGKQISLGYVTLESALPHIRSGRVKVLGVTHAQRSPLFPNYPSIAEALPGYEVMGFFGFLAPAKTPAAIVNHLSEEIGKVLHSSVTASRLSEMAAVVSYGPPAQFAAFLHAEIDKYADLARRTGVKVEE